ncbi:MAG: tetratricopeptide repeat protein [Bryobacteraceae bacterium]
MGIRVTIAGVTGMLALAFSSLSQVTSRQEQIESNMRQAQQYLRTNRPDLAISEFKAILALDPNNVTALGDLGTLLYFQGNYEEAAANLRAAVKIQPSLWKTETLLGMCEKRTGDMVSARGDLERAFPELKEEKLRVEAGMQLIEIYYGSRELDKAAAVVSILRQLKPDDPQILYTAHRIYTEQADETMLSVAMVAPKSAWMHQLAAEEMVKRGNSEAAIKHFREALRIDPQIPGVHFELGEVLSASSSTSDQEQAEREYQAALLQDPSDEKSECRLGKIALNRSNLTSALNHYTRAVALQPDDPEANLGLGKVLTSMGQRDKAEPLIEKAVRLDPSDPVAHFRLGSLYRQMGRAEDARRELAEFQQLKQMKEGMKELYKEMRLQTGPEEEEAGMPQ